MISSEHHRRDISSASFSTGFLLEFQPHSSHCPERGKQRVETARALSCSVKNPVKRVLVGTERVVLVWPSEREKNGKFQHIIELQNCAWLHVWDKDLLRMRTWGFSLFQKGFAFPQSPISMWAVLSIVCH